MKIGYSRQQSSTLMITLVTTSILGFSLASFLKLIECQNISTMRSYYWNAALPVVEAGIEEALTQLRYSPTNLAANGWVFKDGAYFKERSIGDRRFSVSLSTDNPPIIISRGFVTAQSEAVFIQRPRTVKVTVINTPVFAKGLVAKGAIALNGTIRSDSFDSMNPDYSTDGIYDPAKYRDNGDIASNGRQEFEITANGGLKIYGHLSTGPGGTAGLRGNPVIGSKAFINGGGQGIQPGWFRDDMNVDFPDVPVPFDSKILVPGFGTVGGTNYDYVLGSGNYQLLTLNMSGNDKMLVTGNAVLYVPGYVSLSGRSSIYIAPTGCLQLFVGGANASFTGQGVANGSGNATNFYYYGLPSNTRLTLSGNSGFTGVIYAPQAALSLSGGGHDDMDFVGAAVVNSASLSGHFSFHYDENLSRIGPWKGFVVDSWNEVFKMEEL